MKAVSIVLFAGIVACASAQVMAGAAPAQEKVLYSFCSQKDCTDGMQPSAAVNDVNGTLYGTTPDGGYRGYQGRGTVFALDPSTGAETVLHAFCEGGGICTDGATPMARLIAVNGTLYGTTEFGGANEPCNTSGCGTVFAVDPSTDTEKVLYAFCAQSDCADGANPQAGLVDVNGMLYGTTERGGAFGHGTVFVLDPTTGAETVAYSFGSNHPDGAYPVADLIDVAGTLYGTTSYGGVCPHRCTYCPNGDGCGAVFAFDPHSGVEKVLYLFCSQQNCADGQYPLAGLLEMNGMLYGTTAEGGTTNTNCKEQNGCGIAFVLDAKSGTEKVLYSFCRRLLCADGSVPQAGLIDAKGTLYGTTAYGGKYSCRGCGTVFALDPTTGAETVVHAFSGAGDGEYPQARLINVYGTLYGTTAAGGAHHRGTVFTLTP